MQKIFFISNTPRRHALMMKAKKQLPQNIAELCECLLIEENAMWGKAYISLLKDAAVIVTKWMGKSLIDSEFLKKQEKYLRENKIKHIFFLGAEDPKQLNIGFSQQEIDIFDKYMLYGGIENYCNLWLWLCSNFSQIECEYKEPKQLPWVGIYHKDADKPYEDLSSYQKDFLAKGQPVVGLIFSRDEWVWGDLDYLDAIIDESKKLDIGILCLFVSAMPVAGTDMPQTQVAIKSLMQQDGKSVVDVVINTMSHKFTMSIKSHEVSEFLQSWDVPLLQTYILSSSQEVWQERFEGLSATEIATKVTLPELDGMLHTVPAAAKKYLADGEILQQPISERIKAMLKKAKKWAVLRHKANHEKKVAIVFHNYPPKNSNIGSAVGLDTIESVRLLLKKMQEAGYDVAHIPENGKNFIEELTNNATNDRDFLTEKQAEQAQKMPSATYKEFYDNFASKVQEQMQQDWGGAPGDVFVYDNNLIIPGTMNGKIFITVQPPRGFGEDPGKIYHSPFCTPTHHYLAYYKWLSEVWQADAVIHVGTHGSLEWLPGKSVALSEACYADLALGDLPNIYPYLITIVGEGLQAKRHSSACLISYLTPPMTLSGVYDELEELQKMLDEYMQFMVTKPDFLEKSKELILAKVKEANIENEVQTSPNEDFAQFAQELHEHITDIKNMQMRCGLHILGLPPEGEALREYLLALTRMKNGDIPSLTQTIAQQLGFDYYDLQENSATLLPDGRTYGMLIDEIWEKSRQILEILQKENFALEKIHELLTFSWVKQMEAEQQENFLQVCRYICTDIAKNLLLTTREMTNTLRALNGCYIEPGPGGAPTSGGAELLPTGRNFYGIEPGNLPTQVAWEIGKEMGEQIIARYISEEGHYPENIGLILWAGSNMRSHGQCLAEFMYFLGVKPVWQSGSKRVTALEVIPLDELKRPRIDVTARISGLFRDCMPVSIKWLDRAVQLVANLDEDVEQNYVRKHMLFESSELEENGVEKEDAWRKASYRIFGNQLGTYGAGINGLLDNQNWEDIDDLAKVYVRWGAHAYGEGAEGSYMPEQFSKRLSTLDVTIKNENNRESNMLSSDDYNAYHGGMIAAVKSIKGSAPRSYMSDSSDRSKVITRSVQEEMKRVFRGEAVNPKFITGMMEHGYKGAADMSKYLAHSFQWDATCDLMEDWMYEKYAEKYAFDPKVQEWMKDVNPWALKRIAETLLEAEQRGMWQPQDETKEKLRELYLSIEGELEDRSDNN